MGSPEKYSTEQIIQALKESNGLVSLAARRLGCEPQTIYNRAKRVKSMKEVIENCRSELVDLAEDKLRGQVLAGEGWAVCLVLKTLGKNRGYVERSELTGKDGSPVELIVKYETDNNITPSAR